MSTPPPSAYRPAGRPGVTAIDVERTADALLRAGERPTIEKIRQALGTGSPNTINPLLDAWWKRLAGRLDAGPAALQRLPESALHVLETLYLRLVDEAHERARQEQGRATSALDGKSRELGTRAHVLTLREGELEARLRESAKTREGIEGHVSALTSMLAKADATRESAERRVLALEGELQDLRARLTQILTHAVAARRRARRTPPTKPGKVKRARRPPVRRPRPKRRSTPTRRPSKPKRTRR